MVALFSWIIVGCIAFLIIISMIAPFTFEISYLIPIIMIIVVISAVGLIITLIYERIKNRKDDDDAFNKY